jgi:hypothetical protein
LKFSMVFDSAGAAAGFGAAAFFAPGVGAPNPPPVAFFFAIIARSAILPEVEPRRIWGGRAAHVRASSPGVRSPEIAGENENPAVSEVNATMAVATSAVEDEVGDIVAAAVGFLPRGKGAVASNPGATRPGLH